jgi:hypothetical protein
MSYSLLSPELEPQFNSGAVRPLQCFSDGWQLIQGQYFLFVAMCLIIIVLVSCIPFAGIVYGAWMAGIYYALLGLTRGEPASFNAISKGFSQFSQAFIVALLSGLPFVFVGIGAKLMELRFDEIEKTYPVEVPDEILTEQMIYIVALVLVFVFFHLITGLIFGFAYQLVVERNLSGWQATKLSLRASNANFGGVLGLVLIEIGLGALGVMLCCIGIGFVMPISKAAWTVAYRQVFPAPPAGQVQYPPFAPPPPPPPFFGAPNQ